MQFQTDDGASQYVPVLPLNVEEALASATCT